MKVLLLTTDAYGGHGGIALYNRDVAEALAEIPDVSEVTVVVRNMPFSPEARDKKIKFLSGSAGSKYKFVFRSVIESFKSYDFIICGHINLLPLVAALNIKMRLPVVLMVYGIDVWKLPYKMAEKWISVVDQVWCISDVTRVRMNAWANLPDEKYVILPNAIHLDRYGIRERRLDLIERYNLASSRIIMTLGRLPEAERYKGVDEVLEVFQSLLEAEPSLKYLVAGDGNDRARLERKAKALGIADKVVFAGMIREAEKADLFQLADAFVMPGRGEGFGFVFLEAMACGVPAVGSTLDGSREALRGGELGELVNPEELGSVRRGILRALEKKKSIPAGLNYFSWPAFSMRIDVAVKKLMEH